MKISPELRSKIGKDFLKGKPGMTADTFDISTPPIETNTEWESEIIYNLRKWINYSDEYVSEFLFNIKSDLDSLYEEYPFIKYFSNKPVYRGTSIRLDVDKISSKCLSYLQSNPNLPTILLHDDLGEDHEMYRIPIKTNYKGYRNAQSWSTLPEVAANFVGFSDVKRGYLPCILQMPANNGDLYFPWQIGAAYKFSTLAEKEKEVIRISNQHALCNHLLVSSKTINQFKK
jgi:hypothetical protein